MKIIVFSILIISNIALAQNYITNSSFCYDNPNIPSLAKGETCVGLVASPKNINWSMPRKILFINNTEAVVTAMGSWKPNEGQVWKLNFSNGKLASSTIIFDKTDRSHGLRNGPNQWIYYGDATRIYRFKLDQPTSSREIVIQNLPDTYKDQLGKFTPSSHPLKEFIFLKNGDLILNIGAPSNDCADEFKKSRACYQRDQQAELRKYIYNKNTDTYSSSYEVVARGLRNSMGLLYNPTVDLIYQAENAADALGTPDELNLVNPNELANSQDFGWPFCFGDRKMYVGYQNFKSFCLNKAKAPLILFPAHAAPLDMLYYSGDMFLEYKDSIMVSWHGHRPSGSKIAIYKTDSNYQPVSDYYESRPHLNPEQLVSLAWERPVPGGHPKGRPVGIDFDKNGAVFVVDDQNNSLLVVAKINSNTNPKNNNMNVTDLDPEQNSVQQIILTDLMTNDKINQWPLVFQNSFNKFNCQSCHSDIFVADSNKTLTNLIKNNWINPKSKKLEDQNIWVKITGFDGARIMPPAPETNILSDRAMLKTIEDWLILN
jgi:glucose/arabinose dehydrogenase